MVFHLYKQYNISHSNGRYKAQPIIHTFSHFIMVTDKNIDTLFLYMAPIRGITDAAFRNIFHKHFGGCDAAIAPFINPQRYSNLKAKHIADILPEKNTTLPVIPQLLHTDPNDFLSLAKRLEDLGYDHLNWNLGCPAPMVTNKQRGSGLLPYPDKILKFLETVLPNMQARLSIKTRLGFADRQELLSLLPHLNEMPLKEIIIHPRLGKQLYKGKCDLDGFTICCEMSTHTLVYNGDITDAATLTRLRKQFPDIQRWMLGRGLLADPSLAMKVKENCETTENLKKKLFYFHEDLYSHYRNVLFGPSHILGKMKQIWAYLIDSFPEKQFLLKSIKKTRKEDQYEAVIAKLFEE